MALDPKRPDVARYFESGVSADAEHGRFLLTAREANLLFARSPGAPAGDMILAVALDDQDAVEWGILRNVEFLFNGRPVGRFRFLSKTGAHLVAVRIPGSLTGRTPWDRITIREPYPPSGGGGDQFLVLNNIALAPAASKAAQPFLPYVIPAGGGAW
ncbi:MAG: hypothetical protein NTW86_19795 [Candidatus Sumerlaeota bacterium]|nr:hypothetical protein [Candidatus Sumerlaeota bacterium]